MNRMFVSINFLVICFVVFGTPLSTNETDSNETTYDPKNSNTSTEAELSVEAPNDTQSQNNDTQRQRRLIPYSNFYIPQNLHNSRIPYQNTGSQKHSVPIYKLIPQKPRPLYANQQYIQSTKQFQPNAEYNPFSNVNKLPGGFTPMLNQNIPEQIQYASKQEFEQSELYKQLIHQQLAHPSIGYATVPTPSPPQQKLKPVYKIRRPVSYIPIQNYPRYKISAPTKSIVQSYKPIQNEAQSVTPAYNVYPDSSYRPESLKYLPEPHLKEESLAPEVKPETLQYVTPEPIKYTETQSYTPVKYKEEVSITPKPVYIHNENSLTQVLKMLPQYNPAPQTFPTYEEPNDIPELPKQNSLGHLLKALQYSNALPQTFTTNNIGTSIKTLLNILNALQTQNNNKMQFVIPATLPAITSNKAEVASNEEPIVPETVDLPLNVQTPAALIASDPAAVTQFFPQPTLDGGTPGKPGIDYPAYDTIPQTSFDCKTQRYKGFFGDPDTNCQVWHYCDLNGGQASFLCPNGTIFSQVALTCDWWYNVKCATTPQLYVLNERLYKYILPFTPKFPEDYSGPLVDRYITQKFKEQEEEMRRKKKGKTKTNEITNEDVEDIENTEQLQDLTNQADIDRKDVSVEEEVKSSES